MIQKRALLSLAELGADTDEESEARAHQARQRATAALLQQQRQETQGNTQQAPQGGQQEPQDEHQHNESAAADVNGAKTDAGCENVAVEGAGDEWAQDYDERDAYQFDGQDYDHLLKADEEQWESENFAQRLPPGWAKCPNAGKRIMGILPTKVHMLTCTQVELDEALHQDNPTYVHRRRLMVEQRGRRCLLHTSGSRVT
jgi:hypothetical protein